VVTCLFVYLFICLFVYLVIWLFGYLVIWLFGYLVIWLFVYFFVFYYFDFVLFFDSNSDPYCVLGMADPLTGEFLHRETSVRSEVYYFLFYKLNTLFPFISFYLLIKIFRHGDGHLNPCGRRLFWNCMIYLSYSFIKTTLEQKWMLAKCESSFGTKTKTRMTTFCM
jgi:hypothetical protein